MGEIVESFHFMVNVDVGYLLLFGIASKVAKPIPVLRRIYIKLCQRFCFNNEAIILKPCRIPFQVFQYLFRMPRPKNIRTANNQDKTSEGNRKKDKYTLIYKAVSTYRTLDTVAVRFLWQPPANAFFQIFL